MSGASSGPLSDPEFLRLRATVAALTRDRAPDDAELVEARRQMAIVGVAARVRQAVESAPPLPAGVGDRLVELIRAACLPGEAAAA